MRLAHTWMHDTRDWDDLEEYDTKCPHCKTRLNVYFDPNEEDFVLLGLYCKVCDTPYTDLFEKHLVN